MTVSCLAGSWTSTESVDSGITAGQPKMQCLLASSQPSFRVVCLGLTDQGVRPSPKNTDPCIGHLRMSFDDAGSTYLALSIWCSLVSFGFKQLRLRPEFQNPKPHVIRVMPEHVRVQIMASRRFQYCYLPSRNCFF